MLHHGPYSLVVVLFLTFVHLVPAVAQTGSDHRFIGEGTVQGVSVTDDGGWVIEHQTTSGRRVQHYTMDGEPNWGISGATLVGAGPNGSAVLLLGIESSGSWSVGFQYHWDVGLVDPNMNVLWTKRLTLGPEAEELFLSGESVVAVDAQGGLFFTMQFEQGVCLLRSDVQGEVEWAVFLDGAIASMLEADGSGGCFVLGAELVGDVDVVNIIHIMSNGILGYHKRYSMADWYVAHPVNVQFIGGDLMVMLDHTTSGSILWVESNGDVLSFDKYALSPPPPSNVSHGLYGGIRLLNGEYLLVGGYGGVQGKQTALKLSANREPLDGRSLNTTSDGSVRKVFGFQSTGSGVNDLLVAGVYSEWDEVFSTTILEWPVLWRIPSDLSELCASSPVTFAHMPVAPSAVSAVDASDSEERTVWSSPLGGTVLTEVAPWATEGLCELIVGLDDVPDMRSAHLFTLNGNIVGSLNPLSLRAHEELELSMFDRSGRLIHKSNASQDATVLLELADLSPGIYQVMAVSRTGSVQTQPVVVMD